MCTQSDLQYGLNDLIKEFRWIFFLLLSIWQFCGLSGQSTIPTSLAPCGIASADFNGDFFEDLAVVTGGTTINATLTIFISDTVGNFTQSQGPIDLGINSLVSVVTGELQGIAGRNDLAIVSNSPGKLFIFFSNGDGTFTQQPTINLSSGIVPTGLALGHFFSNTISPPFLQAPDIVVANGSNASFTIFKNNGGGIFTQDKTVPTDSFPTAIAAGKIDKFVFNLGVDSVIVAYGLTDQVAVFLNSGSADFQNKQIYCLRTPPPCDGSSLKGPVSIVLDDLNDDGFADFAVANAMDSSVSVLLNNKGIGATGPADLFFPPVNYNVGQGPPEMRVGGPTSIVTGVFNPDGPSNSLAVSNQTTSQVAVLINNGDGTFQSPFFNNANSGPSAITAGFYFLGIMEETIVVTNFTNRTCTFFFPTPMASNEFPSTFSTPYEFQKLLCRENLFSFNKRKGKINPLYSKRVIKG